MKKQIQARFQTPCRTCGVPIKAGTQVWYDSEITTGRRIWHLSCSGEALGIGTSNDPLAKLRAKLEVKAQEIVDLPLDEAIKASITELTSNVGDALGEWETIKAEIDEYTKVSRALIQKTAEFAAAKGREVTVRNATTGEAKSAGIQHRLFEDLLETLELPGVNIALPGPAGSGKSTAAMKCAEVLGLRFEVTGPIENPVTLTGFIDAQSGYRRTPFREVWEHGGVYCMDEADGSSARALLFLNSALANGVCAFPDGTIKRHPDCRIIMTMNTWGEGPTAEFVGRAKLDKASLDRFVFIEWPYDEVLEMAIAPNKEWTKRVQLFRRAAKDLGLMGVMITPRASILGGGLLNLAHSKGQDALKALGKVEARTLRKSMDDETWNSLCHQVANYGSN